MKALATLGLLAILYSLGLDRVFAVLDAFDSAVTTAYDAAMANRPQPERRPAKERHAR